MSFKYFIVNILFLQNFRVFHYKILYYSIVMKYNYINNLNNYNTNIVDNENTIFLKLVGLFHELIEVSIQNITIKSLPYFKYVLINGLKHVLHIYRILFVYTLNLDLTVHYTQKSIIYYTEFIQQINNDSHSFLNLSVKDASLFSLKKTLYEINNDHTQKYSENEDTKNVLNKFDEYAKIYTSIVYYVINSYDIDIDIDIFTKELPKTMFSSVYSVVQELLQVSLLKTNNSQVDIIFYYTNILQNNNYHLSVSKYIVFVTTFIKELYKRNNTISMSNVVGAFEKSTISDQLNTLSPLKFTKKLLCV